MFTWLESTALAALINESLWGYPLVLTLHGMGMAVFVGLVIAISLRVMGFFRTVPLSAVRKLLAVAWLGFLTNLVSGFSLFAGQATYFVNHKAFLIKIASIFAAAALVWAMHRSLMANATTWGKEAVVDAGTRSLALAASLSLCAALIAGRLIAYV